jgi:hypothetical protein
MTTLKSISWNDALHNRQFRTKVIIASILLLSVLLIFPSFFAFIEKREGIVLNDWLLPYIPAQNFSILIFIITWSVFILVIVRSIQQPDFFLTILFSVAFLQLLRIVTIYFVALNPPEGLIALKDPLLSIEYGGNGIFITKDLFFSGHTSNLFMAYLCLQKKTDKLFVLVCTILVAILVLVQHIHYSIDVIGAFIFTFFLVKGVKKMTIF